MGNIPSSEINFGGRSLFPSGVGVGGGGIAGAHSRAPSRLSCHLSAFPLVFVCVCPTTVCRAGGHPPNTHPSDQQTLRDCTHAEVSIHSSPLFGKLWQKRVERTTLCLHHAFYPPPLNPPTSLAVQSFMVGPLNPPVRLSTDLPLKQYSTAGWIKDEFMSEEKRGRRWGGSEEGPAASRAVMMRV